MQLKALTSAALLAGAQALVAPGATKPALALIEGGQSYAIDATACASMAYRGDGAMARRYSSYAIDATRTT